MDKQAALSKAAEYEAEAKRGLPAAIILSDFTNYERSMEEARTYRWLATLHPATRRAWIISNWGGKVKPYAWAETVKADIDRLQENCKDRKRVQATLSEIAEHIAQEADFVRDYELEGDPT